MMEPSHSQMVGAAEECHSCESGWTIYLGSPTHDDDGDHSDDDDEEGGEDRKGGAGAEDEESDDSMASDASTGPSQPIGSPWGDSKGSQLVKEDVAAAATTKEKEIAEKKVGKKEMATFIVDKVRKNHCIRKRK
ncbi:uncharacterized protein LOC114736850 [Neltuma alba]|uniref:uncharacterized protein LOC114721906 n=1 Tax=Neltuma alba TaxID=207710 RepID=UPI0010A34A93|nr:uncharacterized protein LOC114721906 [Prosopis alba]XP_028780570.1 uncharacterized protein LOC114736850 [Prosopis alba]